MFSNKPNTSQVQFSIRQVYTGLLNGADIFLAEDDAIPNGTFYFNKQKL